jgi:hypothetical protein
LGSPYLDSRREELDEKTMWRKGQATAALLVLSHEVKSLSTRQMVWSRSKDDPTQQSPRPVLPMWTPMRGRFRALDVLHHVAASLADEIS